MKKLLKSATLRALCVICAIALVVTALPVALNLVTDAQTPNNGIFYDFETPGDYDTTSSGVLKKYNGTNYVSADVSDGVLKLKNPTEKSYGVSTWVFNSKGSKATFTPGKKYTVSFKWKQAVATTQTDLNTCWLVVANGTKYSGNDLSELSNSTVMPTAGDYGWAGSNTSAPNHRNYKDTDNKNPNRHLQDKYNGKNFSNAQNWGYKTISFVAYDVTEKTSGAKNELAFTACLSSNQEIHIDDLKVEEEVNDPALKGPITYDFETSGDYDTTTSGAFKKHNDTQYASVSVSDGVLKLKNATTSTFGLSTWVLNSKGSKIDFTPGKKYTISFKWKQAVKTTQSGMNTCWLVVANGAKYSGNALSELSNSSVMPTAGNYGWAGSNTSAPNHRNYSKSNKHLLGNGDNFSNADNWQEKTVSFVAYGVTGTAGARNELAFTVCLSPNQEIHIDDLKVEEYSAPPTISDYVTKFDFEDAANYDITDYGYYTADSNSKSEGMFSIDGGVLKVAENGEGKDDYAVGALVLKKNGKPVELTPGAKYNITFKYRYDKMQTSQTPWIVVTQGANYGTVNGWKGVTADSAIMSDAGNYTYATSSSAANHRGKNKITGISKDWKTFTKDFIAYDVSSDKIKNYLCLTICAATNHTLEIDDIVVVKSPAVSVSFETNGANPIETLYGFPEDDITMPADPVLEGSTFDGWYTDSACQNIFTATKFGSTNVTLYAKWNDKPFTGTVLDFEESEKYSTSGKFYGRHTASSPSNYNMFSVENGELVVKGKEETGNSYAVATWVLNKDGKAINIEKGKKYTITFKWKQTRADNMSAGPWLVVANGVNYTPDSGWAGSSAQSAIMPTAGDYKYTTSTSAANYRGKNKHLDGGNSGGRFKVSNNVWQDFSMDFVAYDVTSTPGAKNNLAFTICMCGRQTIVIDDIVVVDSEVSKVVSINSGSDTKYSPIIAKPGDVVTLPANPTNGEEIFNGWFYDEAYDKPVEIVDGEYKFTMPNGNVSVYALWGDKPDPDVVTFEDEYGEGVTNVNGYSSFGGAFYLNTQDQKSHGQTVNYKADYVKGGKKSLFIDASKTSTNSSVILKNYANKNGFVAKPGEVYTVTLWYKVNAGDNGDGIVLAVAGAEKVVSGWYKITAYSDGAFTFPDAKGGEWKQVTLSYKNTTDKNQYLHLQTLCDGKIDGDAKIYIDDVRVKKLASDESIVNIVKNDGSSKLIYVAKNGTKFTLPKMSDTKYYTFAGWYTDSDFTKAYKGNYTHVKGGLTLYAKWNIKKGVTITESFENYRGSLDGIYSISSAQKTDGNKSLRFEIPENPQKNENYVKIYLDNSQLNVSNGQRFAVSFKYRIDNPPIDSAKQLCMSFYSEGGVQQAFWYNKNKGSQAGMRWWIRTTTITNEWLMFSDIIEINNIKGSALYFSLGQGNAVSGYIDEITLTPLADDEVAICTDTQYATNMKPYYIGKVGQSYTLDGQSASIDKYTKFAGWYADETFKAPIEYTGKFKEKTKIFGQWVTVKIEQDFENYNGVSGLYKMGSDYEVYNPSVEGYNSENVKNGKTSIHKKGLVHVWQNVQLLNDNQKLAIGVRFTVSFWVKMTNNLHTDGTIKISSCDSNAYPYAYAGDTFDVITIKELSDKQWHKVTFTFDAAGKKFALIAPGYVELFIDDLVFDYTPDATKSESVVPEKEYEPLLRNTDGTLVENEEKIVDPQLLELKNPDNKVDVETENIIETIIGLGTLPMILICAGAVVVLAGIAVAVIFIIKKAKKSPKKS